MYKRGDRVTISADHPNKTIAGKTGTVWSITAYGIEVLFFFTSRRYAVKESDLCM